MNPLPLEVRKTERIYRQLARNNHAAFYSVFDKNGTLLLGYEAFRIKKLTTRRVFDRLVPAHEAYPSDEDFGRTAWSFGHNFRTLAETRYCSVLPARKSGREPVSV